MHNAVFVLTVSGSLPLDGVSLTERGNSYLDAGALTPAKSKLCVACCVQGEE